jgi:hypothetical protein
MQVEAALLLSPTVVNITSILVLLPRPNTTSTQLVYLLKTLVNGELIKLIKVLLLVTGLHLLLELVKTTAVLPGYPYYPPNKFTPSKFFLSTSTLNFKVILVVPSAAMS